MPAAQEEVTRMLEIIREQWTRIIPHVQEDKDWAGRLLQGITFHVDANGAGESRRWGIAIKIK